VTGTPLCEAATGNCIACHTNAQCSDTEECKNAHCIKLPECTNSLDCASASGGKSICDKTSGVCVQCTADADCGTGKSCTDRVCHISCSSDNDCTAQHMLCNQGLVFGGQCTQCVVSSDCPSGEYCESGTCVHQTCKPAQQSCDGNLVVQCNETGSGVTPLTQCTLALFSSCVLDGDNAKCVGQCEDGKKDGLETDVDCGGACQRCAAGKACVLPTDCSSAKCTSSKCQ
jgi:Cys-rich repeat protein